MTPLSVRMTESLAFVCVLAAFPLAVFARGTVLLVFMTPALITYMLAVRRPSAQAARGGAPATRGRSASGPDGKTRQRRGGRKRRL
jgi:hypothetical protein